MSTITTTIQNQVYLANIVSVSEDRLQSNFRAIMRKLKDHDQMLLQQQNKFAQYTFQKQAQHKKTVQVYDQRISQLQQSLQNMMAQNLQQITNKIDSQQNSIAVIQDNLDKNSTQKLEIKMQISEFRDLMTKQIEDISSSVNKIQQQIFKAFQQIYKKEDSIQALKLSKQIQVIKEKSEKYQHDSKLLEHKLEKIQIIGERAEKNQVKKQTQLLKDIEEKIKKQIKHLQKNLNSVTAQINSRQDILREDITSINTSIVPKNYIRQRISLQPQIQEQQESIIQPKPSLERMAINKLNDRFTAFETKTKALQQKIKDLENTKKSKKKMDQDKIKDRIDQIKPQLVKLWAKCDALDDRIVFSEKRSEQRNKLMNNIIQNQKQNNWSKMQDKLNVFQTQIYATLKQIKMKIQTKVNSTEFEKFSINLEDKIKQITELIYMKSDKIEVKKALLFLEAKIKQIILVISEDQEQEKDALLTRKQLKCISCDKDIDKMAKIASTSRGNWDGLPLKQHSPEILGRFGMTNFGSLSKKLKKLESKDLPVLRKKKQTSQKENM